MSQRPPILDRAMLALMACALLVLPGFVRAQDQIWTVTAGKVGIVCPLTVGGSFEARSTALSGSLTVGTRTPADFGGEVRVDLKTLDTGIELRNRHLRENYLEVDKAAGYEAATLTALALPEVDAARPNGKTPFTARLTVHGVTRPVSGTADLRVEGTTATVEARFSLRIQDYEIAAPRYLGVGVRDEIQIQASLTLRRKDAPQ